MKSAQAALDAVAKKVAAQKDNFETVKVSAKVPKKDAEGKRVKEVVDGKKVTVYEMFQSCFEEDTSSPIGRGFRVRA